MTEVYSPGKVQEMLGIDSNTLRKYATLLEGHAYQIQRNNRGHRLYYDKEIIMLRKLVETSKQPEMTMEHSVQAVMEWISEENKTEVDSGTELEPIQNSDKVDEHQTCNLDDLIGRIEHLEQINGDLLKHLKEKAIREAYLEDKINQILKYVERTERLVDERSKMIEEETRKQIAAAHQQKWWQWWR
jgi:DNA-binding transcriptional MerR regulator